MIGAGSAAACSGAISPACRSNYPHGERVRTGPLRETASALAIPKSVTTATPTHREHVLRLDVAMHDAAFVGVRGRLGDIAQNADGFGDRESTKVARRAREDCPSTNRHCLVWQAVRLTRADGRDVRVLEVRRELSHD